MLSIKEITDVINTYASEYNKDLKLDMKPEGLYDPVKYILSIGGKRVRPVLMLLTYNMFNDNIKDIMNKAMGLEIYHNFTLLHDDLMDKSDMRRGNPTVHKKWDENTAILSGDTMLIMAYRMFFLNGVYDGSARTFEDAVLGVCEGQQFDMEFENRMDVTIDEYMEMIRLKTSLLLGAAAKIGAQSAKASEEDCQLLYEFGEKVGLAFQVQDDLLDVYGDTKLFKKKLGSDIVDNKKTYLLITALNSADKETRKELDRWIECTECAPEDKIQAITKIYNELGVAQIAQEKVGSLFKEARECLEKVSVPEGKKVYLKEFADTLLGRKY